MWKSMVKVAVATAVFGVVHSVLASRPAKRAVARRFGELSSQELICSNGLHACLVVGEHKTKPENLDWDIEGVALFKNGELAASGVGAEIM